MIWLWHHALLLGLIAGITALCVYFPALAVKWRSTLVAVLICALFAQWFFDRGVKSQAKATAKVQVKLAAAKQEVKAQAVTIKVVDHYITQTRVVHERGATIIREVNRYVPSTACPLPAGFGVLHDAAAQGVPLPEAADVPDGPAVSAQVVAETVAANYTTCHETEAQLAALQAWVKEQAAQ